MPKRTSYIITIPVEAESINDVVREGGGFVGLRTLREKWSKIAEHSLIEAIDESTIPPKFTEPISVRVTFYFKADRTRDGDNYYLVVKSFLDAMTRAGIIEDDSSEFVDFDGMRFRKSTHSPRIEVEITLRNEPKEIVKIEKVSIAKSITEDIRNHIGPEYEDMSLGKIKLAAYLSLPKALRPSKVDIAKELKIHNMTLYRWEKDFLVEKLALRFAQNLFAYDLPDVIESQKLNALAGNPTSAKIFIDFVQNKNNEQEAKNIFLLNLTKDEVDSLLTNLESKHAKDPKVIEGVEVTH